MDNTTVQIISKELIKPSSPTPDHLKTHKLSLTDLLTPPVYISLLFFYEADEFKGLTQSTDDHTQICHLLKQSLSNTLTIYYPLAGKIDPENFTIDCDDNGVEFVAARAQDRLGDIIENPNLKSLEKYLPMDPLGGIYKGEGTLFMAQVNFFECGGVAVAACVSHVVADGDALMKFMKEWTAAYRGQNPSSSPSSDFGSMANHLPARDLSDSSISPALLFGDENVVMKRFMFDREKLSALKQKATTTTTTTDNYGYVKDPTRVELITAFIWKHFLENKLLDAKKSFVAHVVNVRRRMSPSAETGHPLGNEHFLAVAWTPPRVPELHELVGQLRRAIRRIDDEYIREARDQDRYVKELGELCDVVSEGKAEGFLFSSWARFPLYEVDFGWGRPARVGTTAMLLNNLAVFMNTKSGDDIEVWMNMRPENVEAFENQFKLIN
ncbi:vinorine synthase [Phtheirospermum japonicum]|uniref:Vinorine synthase n=1 Tax=Phtheirospermum japonicum TaxID=374723 RepID=A0A830C4C1_9LAMI|nr:vinorine synthase [Phtheirospermum japonicum]